MEKAIFWKAPLRSVFWLTGSAFSRMLRLKAARLAPLTMLRNSTDKG